MERHRRHFGAASIPMTPHAHLAAPEKSKGEMKQGRYGQTVWSVSGPLFSRTLVVIINRQLKNVQLDRESSSRITTGNRLNGQTNRHSPSTGRLSRPKSSMMSTPFLIREKLSFDRVDSIFN